VTVHVPFPVAVGLLTLLIVAAGGSLAVIAMLTAAIEDLRARTEAATPDEIAAALTETAATRRLDDARARARARWQESAIANDPWHRHATMRDPAPEGPDTP